MKEMSIFSCKEKYTFEICLDYVYNVEMHSSSFATIVQINCSAEVRFCDNRAKLEMSQNSAHLKMSKLTIKTYNISADVCSSFETPK